MKPKKSTSLLNTPVPTCADVPKASFPLGCPQLKESRVIKELRAGLAHVHVERGGWGSKGRPKFSLSYKTHDRNESDKARAGFESLGLKVHQLILQEPLNAPPRYCLSAGEFGSMKEAIRIAYKIPIPVQIHSLSDDKKGGGPYVIDIIILDPKKYRGKVITAWSESIWRTSPLELALKRNAVVATNGSWFEYSINDISGIPSGVSITEGMWHHEHHHQRQPGSIIAIVEARNSLSPSVSNQEGILFIENDPKEGPKLSIGHEPPPLPELKYGNGKSIALDGIDRMPKPNGDELVAIREEIFLNSQFSHGHPEETHSIRMISEASSGIGLVLLATGAKRIILEETKSSWSPVTLDLSVPGRPGLNALFTYNILIENGEPQKILDRNGSTARTAIGADAEGKIYLISASVDTSQYESIGASLRELQAIGEFLNLVNFVNMDGGPRSSSMVIEGHPLGEPQMKPYDEKRRVSDCILIIDDK